MRIQHVLLCLPFLFTSCAEDGHGHDHADGDHAHIVCPPCGMDMPEDAETVEVAGMTFATCGQTCTDQIMKDPKRFADDAVQN